MAGGPKDGSGSPEAGDQTFELMQIMHSMSLNLNLHLESLN